MAFLAPGSVAVAKSDADADMGWDDQQRLNLKLVVVVVGWKEYAVAGVQAKIADGWTVLFPSLLGSHPSCSRDNPKKERNKLQKIL